MSKLIFNDQNSETFMARDVKVDVGKTTPTTLQRHLVKVGDKVYMTLTLDNFKKNDPPLSDRELPGYFEPFFQFKADTNNRDLPVKLLKAVQSIYTGGGAQITTVDITYLVDFSGQEPGEQIVNVFARFITDEPSAGLGDAEIAPEIIASSSPFYVHQSIAENLQSNIANGGVNSEAGGLERENVNFPLYFPVGLQPVNPLKTKDIALWTIIRNGTNALSFRKYSEFMDFLFCGGPNPFNVEDEAKMREKMADINRQRSLPFNNVDAYRALKVATEAFVMGSIEVFGVPDSSFQTQYNDYLRAVKKQTGSQQTVRVLPYLALIRNKLPDLDFKALPFERTFLDYLDDDLRDGRLMETCYGLISSKLQYPCFVEYIWSYWSEICGLDEAMAKISMRFENRLDEGPVSPLAHLEIGPLRPLNNLMWGYVQDEQHRLTARRRAYEYYHQYGITVPRAAAQNLRPADSRSKFIEAFHTLLNLCVRFYQQYDDTTVVADGFPIMNALKEVHLILSEGAHNQFGDLPTTARIEMLMQQYILARPEFREFLPARQMVAYPEAWMDRVAVMNQLHGWTKTNVLHFRDLAVFGEQIILSVRYGAWSDVINRDQAANWAIFWRPQIQNYIHAYRAATGVDLTRNDGAIDIQQPSYHLVRRQAAQNGKMVRP